MPGFMIDRETRDVLRRLVMYETGSVGDFRLNVDCGERDAALRNAGRAQFVCRMLDDLGWSTGDPRERYEISMPLPDLVLWLREERTAEKGALGDNLRTLEQQQAGEEGHMYSDHSQQESIAVTRSYIERDHRTIAVLSRLIDELGEPAEMVVA